MSKESRKYEDKPVVVGVCHNYFLLNSKTESMRRIKLSFTGSQLTKLASGELLEG